MLLVAGGFCSLFSHRLSIQLRHPWELLAENSKASFAVTKKFYVCISLFIWQTSRQFQYILEYISNIVYFFLGNLQICSESSMYIDCRMFTSLHLVLCKMRASQLFRDVAAQTLSASQAGRWEGCFPKCFFPHFVQILERAWICWWTSVSRPCVLWFLGLTWVQREVSCPKSLLPTSLPMTR